MKKIMFNDKFGLTQAVLKGRKTITRKVINVMPKEPRIAYGLEEESGYVHLLDGYTVVAGSKYKIGEIVAIAQAYKDIPWFSEREDVCRNMPEYTAGWTNKMFVAAKYMPHHIKVIDIKVERLHDISGEDCMKEGITELVIGNYTYDLHSKLPFNKVLFGSPREAFAALIDKVSGKGTWEKNPFVFAYSFKLID